MNADFKDWQSRRHARIRRVKQLLRWMPRRANVDRYPVLKWFAAAARKRPYLWSFKTSSCTPAFYFGSIITFLPLVGIQIPLAFLGALACRANLPITIALQAISNPLTVPFLYPMYFLLGRRVIRFFGLGEDVNPVFGAMHATFLGGAIIGLTVGIVLDLIYRLLVYEARKHNERHRPPLTEPTGDEEFDNAGETDDTIVR